MFPDPWTVPDGGNNIIRSITQEICDALKAKDAQPPIMYLVEECMHLQWGADIIVGIDHIDGDEYYTIDISARGREQKVWARPRDIPRWVKRRLVPVLVELGRMPA